jgi:hypothetical protein
MRSAYEWLASVCGTQPIRVRLATQAFTFSHGDSRAELTPVVWFADSTDDKCIVAVGEDPVAAGAVSVDLMDQRVMSIPMARRQRALWAILHLGIKRLRNPARFAIQLPEVIFTNDQVLASAFDNQQRQALVQAVAWAPSCRFE